MNSTSPYEILNIEKLDISYTTTFNFHSSLRDHFINLFSWQKKVPNERLDVLENISLKLYRGDRLGILGVNGSGKTSLCRAIAGMYTAKKGTITTHGEVRAIFDTGAAIIPELTGRENAYLLARLLFPNLELKEIVEEALTFTELGAYLDMSFKNYSKGMQARLCLALISARPCDLLILDEVFDGADQFFQAKIQARVKKMIEDSGAVIFVSHSPDHLIKTCNRLIVISDKKIIFDGKVEAGLEVYNSLTGDVPCHLPHIH